MVRYPRYTGISKTREAAMGDFGSIVVVVDPFAAVFFSA